MSLTSFKRRWIEKWCEEVHHHLREGSMCSNVIGYPSEETGGFSFQGMLKSSVPLRGEDVKYHQNSDCTMDTSSALVDKVSYQSPLPVVKFSYSHYQDQRKKVERLVHGLPVLSQSTTQLDRASKTGDNNMPFIVVHGEEHLKTRRERDESLERGKVTSAPASLTAQRLAQELKKSNHDLTSGGIRVNIMNGDQANRIKTAPAFNKSNVSKARRLLAKRNQNGRKIDGQPYSPIENCWTMTEMTWT
ncbi:uncharacterized protein [Haliotis cracherodii]|uniref:uncharacterized protein LOC124129321 n=1 Tax=Haliotis rufescens TaxID=6454 RepID=UPI001EB07980|nr:uncharacterized protein LOC124129321 [Haliotis rufescens]